MDRKFFEEKYWETKLPPPLLLEQIEKYDLDLDFVKFLTTISSFNWLHDLENNKQILRFNTCDDVWRDAWNCVRYCRDTGLVEEYIDDYSYIYDSFTDYFHDRINMNATYFS